MNDSISEDNILLQWEKPLGLTSPGNVKSYAVLQDGVQLPNIITKTNFLITSGIVHGNNYSFEVFAINTNGPGSHTGPVVVNF